MDMTLYVLLGFKRNGPGEHGARSCFQVWNLWQVLGKEIELVRRGHALDAKGCWIEYAIHALFDTFDVEVGTYFIDCIIGDNEEFSSKNPISKGNRPSPKQETNGTMQALEERLASARSKMGQLEEKLKTEETEKRLCAMEEVLQG